jgi:density-regulated protein DRP1
MPVVASETQKMQISDTESAPAEKPKMLPGGKVKKQEPLQVIITSEQRQRKKTVTHVHNLAKFGIKLPDASKLFSKKFACSASAAKDKDSILIQGDVKDDLVDFLLATYPVRSYRNAPVRSRLLTAWLTGEDKRRSHLLW